jgi:hypothetical protein
MPQTCPLSCLPIHPTGWRAFTVCALATNIGLTLACGNGGDDAGWQGSAGASAGGRGGSAASPNGSAAGHAGSSTPNPGSAGNGGAVEGPLALEGQPCSGYTLLGIPENDAGSDFRAMLIDMDGNTAHRWTITGFPPKMLPGGSLIGCTGVFSGSYDCIQMQQVTWTGELEWSFSDWEDTPGGGRAARHHHDLQREGNPVGFYAPGQDFVEQGNTLVLALARRDMPEIREARSSNGVVYTTLDDDVIYEVDWSGALTGFRWYGADHFDEFGFDEVARLDIRTRETNEPYLEWLHGNAISRLGPNRWFDAGHTEFHPDNIIYSSRSANFVIIISHQTGDVLWRIGPDFAGRPEERLGQFVGQHLPHLIPRGLPGAGNILVFDNGGGSGYGGTDRTTNSPNRYTRDWSRVLEFDPITLEIVWQYGSESGDDRYFSRFISNAQRLPNGNTLITIGNERRIIEVTPDKRVVWEYLFEPYSSGGRADWLYRSYRTPPEWLPEGQNEALGNYATWASLFEG